MLRGPSMTGKATDRKTWYKAQHAVVGVGQDQESREAAIAWINWFANDQAAADIDKAERGIPPNSEILAVVTPKLSKAQKAVAKYITDIKPEVANTPIAPPPGGGTIAEVLQPRTGPMRSSGGRAQPTPRRAFVDELKSNHQGLSHERHL